MGFNPGGSGGSNAIGTATDVALSNVTNNEVLTYDSTAEKWQNKTATGGSASDATTSTKGIVQLSGDLAGTAAAPTVAKINAIDTPVNTPSAGQIITATSATAATWADPVVADNTVSTAKLQNNSVTYGKLAPTGATTGQVLAYNGTALTWATPGGLTAVSVKTADYTAAAGEYVPVDSTAGSITITLPSAPADGSHIAVKLVTGSNSCVITRGGSDVFNQTAGATTLTLTTAGIGVTLQYASATGIWYSLDSTPLSALAGAYAPSAGPVPSAYAASNDPRFISAVSGRKVADFTLALADAGTIIEAESASAITVTVPPGISVPFIDNTLIEISQTGLGTVTLAPGSGVTLHNAAGLSTRTQWSSISLRKRPGGGSSLPTANMLMRYKADDISGANGSAVASWPESSGNSLPAAVQGTAGSQPTLVTNAANGHKGVNFDGINDYLSLSGSALDVFRNRAAATVFVIYGYPSAVTGSRTFMSFSSGTSSTSSRVVMIQREPTTGNMSTGGRRLDADGGVFVTSGTTTAPEVGVMTSRFVWSSSDLYLYKNGTLSASNTNFQTTGSTSNTASLAAVIGANSAASAEFFAGRILEILVYGVDDVDTRTAVHTYAQVTYGVSMADYTGAADEWVVTGDTEV
jgi:hypothetical protein